ncbi:MAG: hypothetical protein DME25_16310, partial [Verrucomicrobia bacterium]
MVGYLLAVLAILPHFYPPRDPRHWAVFIPLLVLAIPLLDLVWVVVLRWRIGQPFYQGDTNHLSHRLVRRGLSQTQAVLLIWLAAALVAVAGVRITLFVPSPIFSYTITILWILTLINGFNFMDNMNGLCAGLGTIAALYFAFLAAAEGQYLVALIAFLTFGSLLGFLPYNFPRARAFLGDAGSHLVGYLLAVLAILPHFYTPR